jgi:hypothetical protein
VPAEDTQGIPVGSANKMSAARCFAEVSFYVSLKLAGRMPEPLFFDFLKLK